MSMQNIKIEIIMVKVSFIIVALATPASSYTFHVLPWYPDTNPGAIPKHNFIC